MRNIFIIILSSYLLGQELYDPYTVHHMNIDFYDANYDSILEARWYADDKSYLLADITFNGVIYDSVGVRYKGNSSFVEANESNNPKVPFNIDVEFVTIVYYQFDLQSLNGMLELHLQLFLLMHLLQ